MQIDNLDNLERRYYLLLYCSRNKSVYDLMNNEK